MSKLTVLKANKLLYNYKGEFLDITSLEQHPDNINKVSRSALYTRAKLGINNIDIFSKKIVGNQYFFMSEWRTIAEIINLPQNVFNLDSSTVKKRIVAGWQEDDILGIEFLPDDKYFYKKSRTVWIYKRIKPLSPRKKQTNTESRANDNHINQVISDFFKSPLVRVAA